MDKIDTFYRLVLLIGVNLIEIGPDIGTWIRLKFQLLFRLHNLRSQRKWNILYVKG